MIPLKFYRDDEYVYYNNPNGITKKMTIADFEAMMSGESELPAYSSSNDGEVLSVDSSGNLEWKTLPAPSGGGAFIINAETDDLTGHITTAKTISEISAALNNGTPCFLCYAGQYEGDTTVYHLVSNIVGGFEMRILSYNGNYELQLVSGETNIWAYPD